MDTSYSSAPTADEATTTTTPQQPKRSLLVPTVIAGIAVAAIIGAAVLFTTNQGSGSDSEPTPAAQSRITERTISGDQFVQEMASEVDLDTFYKNSACPFGKWFSKVNADMGLWEQQMVDKYENEWKAHCSGSTCPEGFDKNDHNYNTLLGQGNTLGFVAGSFRVLSNPENVRSGLFATPATLPVIGRFSDFGADGSFQLARLALKIPFAAHTTTQRCSDGSTLEGGAWHEEINFLFTESMDAFPLSDYVDLAGFAGDEGVSWWEAISGKFHAAKVFLRNGWSVMRNRNTALLEKEYYSQTPYGLGCENAMKFRVVPKSESCSVKKTTGADGLVKHLNQCGARFSFQIQVKNIKKDWEVINQGAATGWDEKYITVAEMFFPQQRMSADGASSEALRTVLGSALGLSPSHQAGVHKLLTFHPVMTAEEHRPLGEINSYRSHFYSRHATSRARTIDRTIFAESAEPVPGKPPHFVPSAVWAGSAQVPSMSELKQLFGQ